MTARRQAAARPPSDPGRLAAARGAGVGSGLPIRRPPARRQTPSMSDLARSAAFFRGSLCRPARGALSSVCATRTTAPRSCTAAPGPTCSRAEQGAGRCAAGARRVAPRQPPDGTHLGAGALLRLIR
jgi:hypothetical protein